mmetsp:Transcript_23134/g.41100  ORF Transcript_23134/g.41100 Transcript_23134/m.41100 type:complete len:204 (-) Transcript_23134:1194-1805(-)
MSGEWLVQPAMVQRSTRCPRCPRCHRKAGRLKSWSVSSLAPAYHRPVGRHQVLRRRVASHLLTCCCRRPAELVPAMLVLQKSQTSLVAKGKASQKESEVAKEVTVANGQIVVTVVTVVNAASVVNAQSVPAEIGLIPMETEETREVTKHRSSVWTALMTPGVRPSRRSARMSQCESTARWAVLSSRWLMLGCVRLSLLHLVVK